MPNFLEGSSEERDPGAYVPPPPNEVSIRTLDSDVRSMALSGGNFPQSERVAFQLNKPVSSVGIGKSSTSVLKVTLWIVLGLFVLGALIYFIYPLVSPSDGEGVNGDNAVSISTSSPTLPPVPPSVTIPKFDHKSFFKKPADTVLEIKFNYPVTSVLDLETYNQKISNLLQGSRSTSTLVELEVKGGNDRPLALSQFWTASGIRLLPEDFWAQEFNPDFTFFVFRNKDGDWPGLVTKFVEGRSWLVLKNRIVAMESSADLEELFVVAPGNRFGGFADTLVSGQPARALEFSKPSTRFVYGSFHNYLLISTSLEGLKEAVARL